MTIQVQCFLSVDDIVNYRPKQYSVAAHPLGFSQILACFHEQNIIWNSLTLGEVNACQQLTAWAQLSCPPILPYFAVTR